MTNGKERFILMCTLSLLVAILMISFSSALKVSIGPAKNVFHINSSESFSADFTIEIENFNDVVVIINLSVSESISDFVEISKENFVLNPGDSEEIDATINVPEGGGDYDGEIVALFSTEPEENTTQQATSISSQIVIIDEITFFCGDGNVDEGEECDGNIIPKDCEDYGFNAGSLLCTSNCVINSSECYNKNTGGGSSSGGGGGGSSSGGGGGASSTPTYFINQQDIKEYTTKNMSKGARFKFIIVNGTHYVTVDNIMNGYVGITVASEPQIFDLYVGNERKVDVNEDNTYDLSIILRNIADNKAEISIKEISEIKPIELASEKTNEPINEELVSSDETGEIKSSGITGAVIGFAKNGRNIGLVIAFLIILGGAAVIVYNKKK
jgi:uncharacterized membrane protein YgcG